MALRDFFDEEEARAGIDLSPLIDMVFLLLLYFMVSTTMDQTEGIRIQKAEAVTANPLDKEKFKIVLDSVGIPWLGNQPRTVTESVQAATLWYKGQPGGTILVVPDKRSPMEPFIQIMDGLKAKGIRTIAIGTKPGQHTTFPVPVK
jgi:biopolymer transport protein ExbD